MAVVRHCGASRCSSFAVLMLLAVAGNAESQSPSGTTPNADWPPLPFPDYECTVAFPDAEKLSPQARQMLGIAAQTGAAVHDLLRREGRENFWKTYEEAGLEGALRSIRERAAVHSISCGPENREYRSGVCLNYGLMCAAHGGKQCATCLRAWAAHQCAEGFRDLEAWNELLEAAEQLGVPGLVEMMKNAKENLVDPRTRAACLEAF